ncbi:hypothetical protein BGLT_07156 [Caballeronia glathei]|nr:hypothetical protein BGLT_07156 [Caballeronia glathei]
MCARRADVGLGAAAAPGPFRGSVMASATSALRARGAPSMARAPASSGLRHGQAPHLTERKKPGA